MSGQSLVYLSLLAGWHLDSHDHARAPNQREQGNPFRPSLFVSSFLWPHCALLISKISVHPIEVNLFPTKASTYFLRKS